MRGGATAPIAATCGVTVDDATAIPLASACVGTQCADGRARLVDRMLFTLRRSQVSYVMVPVSRPIVRGVWPSEMTDLMRVRPVTAPLILGSAITLDAA
jgi:hypothetical protein